MNNAATDTQIVIFRVGSEQYALPTASAREVINYEPPRRLPGSEAWVLGVINLRGEIIPVCDLTSALGLPTSGTPGKTIICDSGSGSVGLVVDEVIAVTSITAEDVTRPQNLSHPALAGVINRDGTLIVLLDLDMAIAGEVPGHVHGGAGAAGTAPSGAGTAASEDDRPDAGWREAA